MSAAGQPYRFAPAMRTLEAAERAGRSLGMRIWQLSAERLLRRQWPDLDLARMSPPTRFALLEPVVTNLRADAARRPMVFPPTHLDHDGDAADGGAA